MGEGMSIADAMALKNSDNDGFGGNVWIFFLFFLLAWGGNGLGVNRSGAELATSADLQRGFDTNAILNKLNGLENGLCSSSYENARLIDGVNSTINNGINSVNHSLVSGFNSLNNSISALGYQMQQCCCDLKTQMLQDKYDGVKSQLEQAQGIIANNAQTQYILSQLGRYVTNPPCTGNYCYSC